MTGTPVDSKNYTTDDVKSDYDSMTFLGNPHLDALVLAVQSLGGELWTTRRRLFVVEALMERGIAVTPASIQGYVPTSEQEARWKADRDRLVVGIYEPFLRNPNVTYASPEMMQFDPHKEPDVARKAAIKVGETPTSSTPAPTFAPSPPAR